MNKSLTPPKQSCSRPKKSNKQNSSASRSPSKKNRLTDIQVEEKLRKNREKLAHTLDTYTLLIRSKTPIRCLEHNSAISVYCETENKLLCSSCVFGKVVHKFHKMVAIDKSYDKLRNQIQRMQLPISKEIQQISKVKQIVLNNLDVEIVDMNRMMQALIFKHAQAHKLLEDNLFRIKNKLLDKLEHAKAKHETVALELSFLKELYDVRVPILSQDFQNVDQAQILLYHYSLLSAICSQRKFQGHIWNSPPYQIRVVGQAELELIEKICMQLRTNIGKAPA